MHDLFFIIKVGDVLTRRCIKTQELPMYVDRKTIYELEPFITCVEPAGLFPHEDTPISADEFESIAFEDEEYKKKYLKEFPRE